MSKSFWAPATEELEKIHAATLEVLREVGVRFPIEDALKHLEESGATVDPKTLTAKIPETAVRDALKKAPHEIILYGRDSKNMVRLPDGRPNFTATGLGAFIYDMDTGRRRQSTKEDVENVAKIMDALPNMSIAHIMISPMNVPAKAHDAIRYEIAFNSTTKHVGHWLSPGGGAEAARDVIEIASIVAGGKDELRKKPILTAWQAAISPLGYDKPGLAAVMEYAANGVPVLLASAAMGSGTAPATVAAELVILNAEVLAGLVLVQKINPRNPFIYGNAATIIDQKSAIFAGGAPERALVNLWSAGLAKFYGLPSHVDADSDSKVPGSQAAMEKVQTCLPAAMAGANIISMGGSLDSASTFSYEQLIIDDEIAGSLQRIARGVEFDDGSLAVDLIKKVGIGKHFLGERHTLDNVMKEYWFPRLLTRKAQALEVWEMPRLAELDLAGSARIELKKILHTHQAPSLEPSIRERMHDIVLNAESRSK